jgi:hypothetical protein
VVAAGNNDYRGFLKNNGWIQVGAFARPLTGYIGHGFGIDVVVNASPVPVPPDPPMILKWPIPDGWPSEATTGPAHDTVFSDPEQDISRSAANGEIIEGRVCYAGLVIGHNNVTVRNCIIKNHFPSCIFIDPSTTGTTVENCIIDGYGKNNAGVTGIMVGGTEVTVRRNNIYRCQDGMSTYGHPYPNNLLIEDNFIHHLRSAPGAPHYDCMQYDGGQSAVIIRHNTIMNENGDTSTIMIDNEGGPVSNFLIEDNVMYGAGFTFYVDEAKDYPGEYPIKNVRYLRNLWQPGFFGYSQISSVEIPILRGNVYMAHGGIYDAVPPEGFTVGEDVPENFFGYVPNIQGSMIGEAVDATTGGLTLGLGFRVKTDGQIVGINYPRPRLSSTSVLKIGVWRFTGADKDAGTELLASKTFDALTVAALQHLAFDEPVDVAAGDDLLVGVFTPRGSDGKVWYFSQAGIFWPNPIGSQWGV